MNRPSFRAARDLGVELHQVGSRSHSTNTCESGWIPSPLTSIYTWEGMLAEYRDWFGADSYGANGTIGGSFVSQDIEDYYVNPFELGYGFSIGRKKEDFIGKAALEKLKVAPGNRKKVTFQWNNEDVLKVLASGFEDGMLYKWIDVPQPNFASSSADMILDGDRQVGMSMFNDYSFNERCVLSLGIIDQRVEVGDVLTLRWGSPTTRRKPWPKAPSGRFPRARIAAALQPEGARELRRRLERRGRRVIAPADEVRVQGGD